MSEVWLILGMAAVTFLPRYAPLALAGRIELPELLRRALNYIPVAVLTVIIVQNAVVRDGVINFSLENHSLIATAVAIAIAHWFSNLLLTVVIGLLCFGLLRFFF